MNLSRNLELCITSSYLLNKLNTFSDTTIVQNKQGEIWCAPA